MNKLIEVAIDHAKKRADVNGDGKVDAADFELVAKMVAAEAQQGAQAAIGFAELKSGELVKNHTPLHVVGGSFLAGVVLTLALPAIVKFLGG